MIKIENVETYGWEAASGDFCGFIKTLPYSELITGA
jgi:hypothetical protein